MVTKSHIKSIYASRHPYINLNILYSHIKYFSFSSLLQKTAARIKDYISRVIYSLNSVVITIQNCEK